jgi:hypothetical protein
VDISPHRDVEICLRVTDQVHSILCSAEQHIDTVFSPEKAHLALWIAADQRHDDDLGFFTLEIVNSSEADGLQELLLLDHLPVTLWGLITSRRS